MPPSSGRHADDVPRSSRRTRRHDPERRDRIIGACLEVIADVGVSGTSHRRVAAAADVPLGSMTYHFGGRDELLHEAFARFAASVADQFEHRMAGALDREAAVEAVVQMIDHDLFATQRDLVLTHELYVLAARDPAYRTLTNWWMGSSRAALERHFDPTTSRLLDALIEGLTIHRALDTQPRDEADTRDAVRRITRECPP
ncbi:TetR family transcriptional regulator [Georgenia halophila]|uniref:TetR family transcriptional regulator n=1 Tax=Georgenia halophila TaxID=620889 RepID=A0ABP8LCA2_9MICO